MKAKSKEFELRAIGSIIPYALNAKKHTPAQTKMLATSIQRFGWRGNPILVDKNDVIIAGHGRRLAALHLGMEFVPVVVIDDMTAEEARAFRLADNRSAVGDLDNDILKEELLDLGIDLDGMLDDIFDKKELDFAVADLLVMNESVFASDLDSVMDDQISNTNEKIDASDLKRVPLSKALGFKDFGGSDMIYINRFMAQLEAQSGKTGESAFVDFIKKLIGDISHE